MKKRLLSILLIAVMVLSMLPTAYAAEEAIYGPIGENLLTNGSFEQTGANGMPIGLSDWYLTSANDHAWGVKAFLETDPENVTDGSNALHLKSESSDLMKIGYTVNVEAGKTYVFSYKVKGTTTAPGGMCARINGAYSGSVTPNADSWSTYTYIYESAAAGQIGFEISAAWNAMDVYVDEMAVYEYGEIVEEVPADAAAQIGDTYYATLAEAVAAVPEGETIVLLKDNDETGIVIEKETYFFIDGNACRYDIEENLLAGPCLSRHASGSPYEEYLAVFQYDYDHNTAYTDNGDGTHDAVCDCGKTDADNEACVYEEGICPKCGAEEPKPEEPVYGPIGENLLANGSFEQVGANDMPIGLSDWYLTSANDHAWGVKAFLETDPANVTDGSNSLYLKSESSDLMKIGYAVNVEAGKSYIFSYKVKGTTTAPGGMCARINGAYSGSVTPNADSWSTYTYIYESAAAGQIGFEISAAWNAMDVYVDEMAVYEYGEVSIDTAVLQEAIAAAEALVEEDYTEDSWAAVEEALAAANAALESTVQADIDAAAAALNEAVAALEKARVYGPIGENLLTNGSFEQTGANGMPIGLSDWYLTSANDHAWGVKAFLETDPANVTDGNNALHLKSESSDLMKIGYAVNVEAGKTYVFSYKVKGTAPNGMCARINGAYSGSVTPNADSWSTYTYIYESAAAGQIGFEISAAWNAMDVYVDEMAVYEYGEIVDEPEEPVYGPFGKNYITNGSFESLGGNDMPVGLIEWYNDGAMNHAWGVKAFLETDPENVAHGNHSLHVVDPDRTLLRIGFEFSLEANKTYILSYKVKGTSEAPVGARINGSYICDVTPNPDEWKTYTYIFEAGATTYTHFEFTGVWNNALDLYVDDMRMYEYGLITDETEPPEEPEIPEQPSGSDTIIPEGENLVVNGSFEDLDTDGKPMGMTFGGSSETEAVGWGSSATLVTEEGFASDGSNALKLHLDDSGYAVVSLRAYVTPNTKYILTMDGRGTSNLNIGGKLEYWKDDSGNAETSYLGGEEPDTYTAVNPDSWTSMSYVFTTPAGCIVANIAIRIPWTNGTLYVDNVGVYRLANNFAENGSFEDVENGQAVGIKASDGWSGANVSLDTTEENVKDGSYSLKLTADGDDRYWAMVPARNMTPGATYQISFWMKGDMKNNDGSTAMVGYSPDLFVDNNGHGMAEYYAGKGKEGSFAVTDDWQYCVEYITLPNDVVALTLAMGGYSGTTGTVWFDDVRIVKYEEAAIGEILNERIFYYPEDGTGYAELTFSEGYHVADNYTVNAYLMDGDEILAQELALEVVDDYAIFNYDLSLLTEKENAYTVKAEIVGKDGAIAATLSEDIYVYDRPTHLNENGEFINDDGTVFNAVFGGWWPSHENFREGLLLMKEAGVTVIQWSIPGNYEEAIEELDILDELGMKAQVVMYWDMQPAGHPLRRQDKIEAMEAVKDHPAIYAWKVADEPNATATPPEGMTVRELMAESYKFIRSVDMDHPVTYIEADYRHYADADDYADIVMIDPYPGKNSYASYTGDRVADIVSKIERPVTMCLQGFRFDGGKPTAVELHSMNYQSYLAGARHTGWYGFYGAGSNNLETDPELYPALNGFYTSGEWEILFKQYSSGKNPTIESVRESNVWYDVFEQDGMIYAALQNRTYGDVTVSLAGYTGFEAITWSDDVAVNAAIVDGALEVTLTEAQALLLKLTADEPETGLKIVTQPASYEGLVGDTVEFTVVAEGEGLTYQWYYKAVGSDQWLKSYSTGADTATLSVELRAYRDGQQYKCVVTDANGETVESEAAAMTLKAGEFAIVSQPASYAGAEGDTVTFTVDAEGDNLTYRWKYSTDDGATWKDSWSEGYATDTLTVELKAYRDGQQYKCVVTNAKGEAIESDAASMSLKVSGVEITEQPENATVAAGETVTFTVEAEGENLKYRWYRSSDRETWTETWLTGYNTNELSFVVNATRASYAYKCVITSGTNTVETDAVSVVVK